MWKGVSVDPLLAEVDTNAKFVSAWCGGGYTTNFPIEDMTGGRAWIADEFGGEPLHPEHGGPCATAGSAPVLLEESEAVRGLELRDHATPGLWESYGYHNYGDPWREQRYQGD